MLTIATGYVVENHMQRDFSNYDEKFWMPLCESPGNVQFLWAKRMYLTSKGKNIVIFTQSENILNGARVGRLQDDMDLEGVLYTNPHDPTDLPTRFMFNEDARLHQWPEGFFDQVDKDLLGYLIHLLKKQV